MSGTLETLYHFALSYCVYSLLLLCIYIYEICMFCLILCMVCWVNWGFWISFSVFWVTLNIHTFRWAVLERELMLWRHMWNIIIRAYAIWSVWQPKFTNVYIVIRGHLINFEYIFMVISMFYWCSIRNIFVSVKLIRGDISISIKTDLFIWDFFYFFPNLIWPSHCETNAPSNAFCSTLSSIFYSNPLFLI